LASKKFDWAMGDYRPLNRAEVINQGVAQKDCCEIKILPEWNVFICFTCVLTIRPPSETDNSVGTPGY
jgi:hypothetical protein